MRFNSRPVMPECRQSWLRALMRCALDVEWSAVDDCKRVTTDNESPSTITRSHACSMVMATPFVNDHASTVSAECALIKMCA
ncbi:hypothetical protein V6N11_059950 [Hibiscus sabdariffa]